MSENQSKKRLRSDDHIFLIERSTHQIVGSKLPSNRQVLQVFFYNKSVWSDENKCARLVIDEVAIFWQKARIPTSSMWYCTQKMIKLYEKWKSLNKSSTRRTETQVNNETEFLNVLDDLFDIAAVDALTQIKNEEDKAFLITQREKGRRGCLIGIDRKERKREEKRQERIDAEEKRKEVAEAEKLKCAKVHYDYATDDDDVDDRSEEGEDENYEAGPSRASVKNKKNIYTHRLIGALDKCEVSDRNAVHVISAVLRALDMNVDDFILSCSSMRNYRSKHREEIAMEFLHNVEVFGV